MIVCQCKVVTDRDVAAIVDRGARTVAQVCRATGVGTDCGGCIFTVKKVVCDHVVTLVTSGSEAVSEAS
ncbi:(2Fe-2S)-binding protein [Raineyella fluvialis]|uniref:Bacterioferritin-associated ferredoxin n=1 Tax=Raineyella fluvialis TaxID=2662261 RepID=A0A5Q2FDI0_9ACTN|nr:(2Fe-2S)-binding protein [Raineyella fluvialis]